jgi:hypothetical protein
VIHVSTHFTPGLHAQDAVYCYDLQGLPVWRKIRPQRALTSKDPPWRDKLPKLDVVGSNPIARFEVSPFAESL